MKMGNEVQTLSNDIHVITAEINAYQRIAGEAIFEIGKRLKHVKENDLAHGEWSKWCESIGMSRGQATKFITVFDGLSERNGSTSNQIGLEALYQIATIPPEQREQVHTLASGEQKTVDEMTVRELREVKAELKRKDVKIVELESQAKQATEKAEQAEYARQIAEEINFCEKLYLNGKFKCACIVGRKLSETCPELRFCSGICNRRKKV